MGYVSGPISVLGGSGADGDRPEDGTGLWFTTFGLRIGVPAHDPGTLAQLASRPPDAWHRATQGPCDRLYSLGRDPDAAFHTLSVGTSVVDRAATLDLLLDALEIDARHFAAEFAREHVFVHAGSVAVDNRVVVIPGRSGIGKSTLVRALACHGATYYSDEYAVFDSKGLVHAYPKPLMLWTEQGSKAAANIDPSAARTRPPLPLGAILCGRFEGLGTAWRSRTDRASTGMMALLDNTVAIRRQPATTMAFLERALKGATVLVGPRGDADQTAVAVLQRLECEWR